MREQRREPEYGAYPRLPPQPPQQPYPYPQQVIPQTPYGRPVRAGSGTRFAVEFAALMTTSVLTVVVGVYCALVAFITFLGLGMSQGATYEPGVRERYEVMALLLCPGPFVALGLAFPMTRNEEPHA